MNNLQTMATTLQEWMNDVTIIFPVNKSLDYSSQIQTVTTCRGKIEQAEALIKDASVEFNNTLPVLMSGMVTECNEQFNLYEKADSALGYMEQVLYEAQQVAVVESITGHEIDYQPDDCTEQVMILDDVAYRQMELIQECNESLELLYIPNDKEV